jgi:hypothetical protein
MNTSDYDKNTYVCSITQAEIAALIEYHARQICVGDHEDRIERMNYLAKRLKAVTTKPEIKIETVTENQGWPTT